MISYSVFVESHIAESFPQMKPKERNQFLRLFRKLRHDPFLEGDYVERDHIGRLLQVVIVGQHAVVFWTDHAVKEVKVIDLRFAGH
jgi:hypothetical protein